MLLGATALLLTMLVPAIASAGKRGNGQDKVTICHVPPGNPDNAHTITVGKPAVKAHLAHGDSLGKCHKKPDHEKKVVYYKQKDEKSKQGYECVKAPNKGDLPKDSYDNKYYTDSECKNEKTVFVKTHKKAEKYKCEAKNKFWAIEHDKKMFKDGPSKKSKGCTEPYKKFHA